MADNKSTADPIAEIAERALKKTSIVHLDGWNSTDSRYLFVAPYDCRIDQVSLLSDTAVQASDSNYYSLQIRNLTQSESLLSSQRKTRTSDDGAITGDEVFELSPDQNQVLNDGDVLELLITEAGSPADLTDAELVAVVEYT